MRTMVSDVTPNPRLAAGTGSRPKFSLFYFTDSAASASSDRYLFLLETARFADEKGFTAVWTPERHFHSFGGLYPNPSVLSAALAMVTNNVAIRAGSVVLPLHHPMRVCEEWSIVDNLSHGRVGISFASGWHPVDFVFAPDAYERRRDITFERVELVRKLWRGEPVQMPAPRGVTFEPTLFPKPVQSELPVWITTSGSPETFKRAGKVGANILAALIGQSIDQLAVKVALYRRSREEHGFAPDDGIVTLMMHTFIHDDPLFVRSVTREPLRAYLAAYIRQHDDMSLEPADSRLKLDVETELDFAYERYLRSASLIGSPDHCAEMVARVVEAGVDEIACLIDFGLDIATVMPSLEQVVRLSGRVTEWTHPAASDGPATGEGDKQTNLGKRLAALTPEQKRIVIQKLREPKEWRPPELRASEDRPVRHPLGIDQERMWRLEQASRSGPANLVASAIRIRGPLQRVILEESLNYVILRHEVLRTTFEEIEGEPSQVVAHEMHVPLTYYDLRDTAPTDQRTEARRLLTSVAREPFEFDHPLLRVALLQLQDEHYLLGVILHHIITDWVSYGNLLRELFTGYEALVQGLTVSLPPVGMQYGDWVRREKEWLRSEQALASLDYWSRELQGTPDPVTFPPDRPRPSVRKFGGERQWMIVPEDVSQGLRALSRRERSTLFMTILVALDALLFLTTEEQDFAVGAPSANRSLGTTDLMGPLLNAMVLRAQVSSEDSFLSVLQQVRAKTITAFSHAGVPLAEVARRVAPDRWLNYSPLFRVRYLFLEEPHYYTTGGLNLSSAEVDPRASLYDATVSIWDCERGLYGRFEFDPDLFDRSTIVRLMNGFGAILSSVAEDDRRPLTQLPRAADRTFTVDQDQIEDFLETLHRARSGVGG